MKLYVGSKNPVKIGAAENTLRTLSGLEGITAIGVSAPSGVADQPMTEAETRLGAVNRVAFLREQNYVNDEDWCVALEGGVDNFVDGPATFAYVVINQGGRQSVGRSASLPLPLSFYQELQQGDELGNVMDRAFGTQNVKQKGGAIGLLTNNLATRQSVYEVAMTLALAKFRHPALFE
jgi:inosine/xanthosine triphosphatase